MKTEWKTTTIAVAFFVIGAVLGALVPTPSKAACISPAQTIAELNRMAIDNDFGHELYEYKGAQAKNIREYIKQKIQQETYDFDTVVLARRDNFPNAYIGIFKDGCQVSNGVITAEEYFEVKTIGDGV